MTQTLLVKAPGIRKQLGHTRWVKIVLGVLFFVPPLVQSGYDPAGTSRVVSTVLAHPLSLSIPALLPLAKGLLLAVTVAAFVSRRNTSRLVLGYYALILLVVGIFQNMAFTDRYGFAWLIGNTLLQFIVAGWCLWGVFRGKMMIISRDTMNPKRLWVLLPMAIAFLFPYNFDSIQATNLVHADFGFAMLYNDAGVTYCMVTPVLLGILIVFSSGVNSGLLSVTSFVAAGFGLLNMATWFALQPQDWWMGVLHLPLMVLSIYGFILARGMKSAGAAQDQRQSTTT